MDQVGQTGAQQTRGEGGGDLVLRAGQCRGYDDPHVTVPLAPYLLINDMCLHLLVVMNKSIC